MAKQDEFIKAYFLRTDEECGVPYQGYVGSIANTLKAKQKYVNFGKDGGLIQAVHLNSKLDVVCHDEGKQLGFPSNRAWIDGSGRVLEVFAGNIMVVRHKGDQFASIHAEDIPYIEKYLVPVLAVEGRTFITVPRRTLPRWERGTNECSD